MLDFYLIRDEQPSILSAHLKYVGGIEWEEFEAAQIACIIENHLDYYEKFRWSNEQIKRKIFLLKSLDRASLFNLTNILEKSSSSGFGLLAFGD